MRFNIINHLIHWFLPAHKDSLRTLSPSRIFEKSEKEPKGKGIEIDKFCLKSCCHYGSRLVIINSYFVECEYHEIKYPGKFMNKLQNPKSYFIIIYFFTRRL